MKKINLNDYFDLSFKITENAIRVNRGSTLKHELAKFLLCWEAMRNGHNVITEAIFKNGKRADIFVIELEECWEVIESESKESIKKKSHEYPFPVVAIKADFVLSISGINPDEVTL